MLTLLQLKRKDFKPPVYHPVPDSDEVIEISSDSDEGSIVSEFYEGRNPDEDGPEESEGDEGAEEDGQTGQVAAEDDDDEPEVLTPVQIAQLLKQEYVANLRAGEEDWPIAARANYNDDGGFALQGLQMPVLKALLKLAMNTKLPRCLLLDDATGAFPRAMVDSDHLLENEDDADAEELPEGAIDNSDMARAVGGTAVKNAYNSSPMFAALKERCEESTEFLNMCAAAVRALK